MPKWTDRSLDLGRLLEGWAEGAGPRYARLATAFAAAIERGDLLSGTLLPAERRLAEGLRVSRTTVVLAYGELRKRNFVESLQGSGTWVSPRGGRPLPKTPSGRSYLADTVTRAASEEPVDSISFMGACLPALDGLMGEAWDEARDDVRGLALGAGYSPQGLPALREAVAARYAQRGVPTSADQVLVTAGAQQAIDLLTRFLVSENDAVVLEDPTYLGAIDAFTLARARLVAVPVTAAGVDAEGLRRAVSRSSPSLVYLVPSFHNPTGTVLPREGRREAAELAERSGTVIVEDESLVDLPFGEDPPPPIAAFSPRAPVFTIGSMSKLFWGGLRVGWVRGPRGLVERLTRLKVSVDLSGSVATQALAARLLGRTAEVGARRRSEVKARFEQLARLLRAHLPEWTFAPPRGGLTLWVQLPGPLADELAEAALRHGVSIVPGRVHSPTGGFSDHVRLPFVLDQGPLAEGVARLARAWAACPGAARSTRLGVIV